MPIIDSDSPLSSASKHLMEVEKLVVPYVCINLIKYGKYTVINEIINAKKEIRLLRIKEEVLPYLVGRIR